MVWNVFFTVGGGSIPPLFIKFFIKKKIMAVNYLLLLFCFLSLICSVMVISSKNPIHSILYLILVFCNVTFVLIILGIEFIAVTFLIVYVGAIAVLFLFVVMMLNIKILELNEVFWKYAPAGFLISCCFIFQLFYMVFNFDIFELLTLSFYNGYYEIYKVSLYQNFIGVNSFLLTSGVYLKNSTEIVGSGEVAGFLDFFGNTFCLVKSFSNSSSNFLQFSNEITNTELLGWLVYTYTFFIFLVVSLILLVSMVGSIILVLNQNINVKRQIIFRQTLKNLQNSVLLKN